MAITEEDVADAGRYPLLGWPEYNTLFPKGKPDDFLRPPISQSGNLRGLLEDHGWRSGENLDPLTQALRAEGAITAEQYTFRMLGANFHMGCSLIG